MKLPLYAAPNPAGGWYVGDSDGHVITHALPEESAKLIVTAMAHWPQPAVPKLTPAMHHADELMTIAKLYKASIEHQLNQLPIGTDLGIVLKKRMREVCDLLNKIEPPKPTYDELVKALDIVTRSPDSAAFERARKILARVTK